MSQTIALHPSGPVMASPADSAFLHAASEQLLTCSKRLLLWSTEARASLSKLSSGTSRGEPAPLATSATTGPAPSTMSETSFAKKG